MPNAGTDPTRGPAWPKRAVSDARARSQATLSSLPPPTQTPCTTEITGLATPRTASTIALKSRR